jgi:hypothetical protein
MIFRHLGRVSERERKRRRRLAVAMGGVALMMAGAIRGYSVKDIQAAVDRYVKLVKKLRPPA